MLAGKDNNPGPCSSKGYDGSRYRTGWNFHSKFRSVSKHLRSLSVRAARHPQRHDHDRRRPVDPERHDLVADGKIVAVGPTVDVPRARR